jgi:hypothetical protein
MMHHRAAIRRYVATLLTQFVDVGGRIFISRPSPLFKEELPAICVFFGGERVSVASGDRYNPREYERVAQINIDIMVEEPRDPATASNLAELSQDGEDLVDRLAYQVECAFLSDPTLGTLLPDWDKESGEGLISVAVLDSSTPYTLEDNRRQDSRILGMRLQYNLIYDTSAIPNTRFPDFLDYHVEIVCSEPEGADIEATGKVRL